MGGKQKPYEMWQAGNSLAASPLANSSRAKPARNMAAPPPLARSRIPPATQATFFEIAVYQSGIRKRGKIRLNRKLNQVVTGSCYPIKIYILGSCDKDGFDMAAGVNLNDVRIEETLKIRIGKTIVH